MSVPESTISSSAERQMKGEAKAERQRLTLIFLIGCLLYLPGLGSYGPLDPTDSFFIEAGREAVETGQYLVPMNNYQPWLDKPILYFWAVSASIILFGGSEAAIGFSGRIFTALTAIVFSFCVYYGSRSFIGKKQAFFAALIAMTFPLSAELGHISLTDMPLTLFMSAGLYGLFHYFQQGKMKALWLGYISLALAFLCKGPIALIVVGAILTLYFLATAGNIKTVFASILKLKPFFGLALITALNLPWYAAATIGTNGAFFRDFFITQNFGRMVGTVNHQQPFWFYIPVLAGGLFPFNLLYFCAPVLRLRKQDLGARLNLSKTKSFIVFQTIWALFVLLLFSIIKTKLPTYILPAMAPLAVLAARAAALALRLKRKEKFYALALIPPPVLIAALVVSYKSDGWVQLFLSQTRYLFIFLLLVSLVNAILVFKGKLKQSLKVLSAAAITGVAVCMPLAHIAFFEDRQRPVDNLTRTVLERRGSLCTIIRTEPSFPYFLKQNVPLIKDESEAKAHLAKAQAPVFVMAPKEVLQNISWFGTQEKITVVNKTRKWTLFEVKP